MLTNKGNSPDQEHIAYFTMEVGLSHNIPTYSGGLGILAGDTLKTYADIGLPAIGVTLLNEKGYFYQRLDSDGNQIEDPVQWSVNDFMVLLPNEVIVKIEGRDVKIKAWKYTFHGIKSEIPILFLDTNVEGNSDYDKTITSYLYGGDKKYRLCQEIVLGIGGIKMLESIGYNKISRYHMNEGHAGLLTVELIKQSYHENGKEEDSYDIRAAKEKCVFTTHTPVVAGHDRFDVELFRGLLGNYIPEFILKRVIDKDNKVNMTFFGLNFSRYINGVAKRHEEVTKEMFPSYQIDSITNGVHADTWTSASFKELFDKYMTGWKQDPTKLRGALFISREEIWDMHQRAKKQLLDEINQRTNAGFDVDIFTIGFARRFTSYKRPDMLLHNLERLKKIAEKAGEIQIIYAGKAHKSDQEGKDIIKKVFHMARELKGQKCKVKLTFVEDYNMNIARFMVSGCDIWLNTPQRPYEASGTSGMKAALNGVPQFSTFDGWWLEGGIEGITGWSIGAHPHDPDFNEDSDFTKDENSLYEKLEKIIIPLFYNDRLGWTGIMRNCIAINASYFNTYRMAQQYIAHAYNQ